MKAATPGPSQTGWSVRSPTWQHGTPPALYIIFYLCNKPVPTPPPCVLVMEEPSKSHLDGVWHVHYYHLHATSMDTLIYIFFSPVAGWRSSLCVRCVCVCVTVCCGEPLLMASVGQGLLTLIFISNSWSHYTAAHRSTHARSDKPHRMSHTCTEAQKYTYVRIYFIYTYTVSWFKNARCVRLTFALLQNPFCGFVCLFIYSCTHIRAHTCW